MSYRVYQWATGTVGRHAARVCAERNSLELLGVYSATPDKLGVDIGEVIGLPAMGRAVTASIDDIAASDADVVLHAPIPSLIEGDDPDRDLKDICRLLEAGKNVITVVGYMYPRAHGPELVDRLERACQAGGSSFHSSGYNPGWMGDLLPLWLASLSRSIEHIHVHEISNFQGYPSPEIMFGSMGFGSPPDVFEANNSRRRNWLDGLFSESVLMVSDGAGLGVESVDTSFETTLAPTDLDTAAGVVRAGTVAGQHYRWSGMAGGREVIAHETVWRMHASVAPEWAVGNNSITIEGKPRFRMEITPDMCSDTLQATAMHAVNAIPAVCDAAPGIRTFLDLPWILPSR